MLAPLLEGWRPHLGKILDPPLFCGVIQRLYITRDNVERLNVNRYLSKNIT